jgi:hypothetical protein
MRHLFTKTKNQLVVTFCAAALTFGVALSSPALAAGDPLKSSDLGEGRYSASSMLLEKFFFKILTVDVRFGKATQAKIAEIAQGKPYSKELEPKLAQAAIEADRVVVQLRFKRDVPLERWMGVVRDNIEEARTAGLISAALEKKVSDSLPVLFAGLKERGFTEGDRVYYEVKPDSLRTSVVSVDGKLLMESVSRESDVPRVVLASYFAPGSEFRTPLLKALLK